MYCILHWPIHQLLAWISETLKLLWMVPGQAGRRDEEARGSREDKYRERGGGREWKETSVRIWLISILLITPLDKICFEWRWLPLYHCSLYLSPPPPPLFPSADCSSSPSLSPSHPLCTQKNKPQSQRWCSLLKSRKEISTLNSHGFI